ncbi:MAG: Tim44/TimA family putative adaptor protein [Neomegalonema sp.]|nr:Tim44/TimA family putative adaptor protein [Neomegalonema sp.]
MSDNDLLITIILAAVAGFLLFRLRNVLGERTGFEDPDKYTRQNEPASSSSADDNVTPFPGSRSAANDPAPDAEVLAVAEEGSPLANALMVIKRRDSSFSVTEFMTGARGAYEMLLTAFEAGDTETLKPFLAPDVFTAFSDAIAQRKSSGLSVEMKFVGLESAELIEATVDDATGVAEISVRYAADVISATRNSSGEIVEGDENAVRRIGDVWTYSRMLGNPDPNWTLTATGE